MDFLLEGEIIQIVVPLTDRAGNAIAPTALSAKLSDGEGLLLQEYDPIAFLPGDTSVTVTVLGALNMLSEEGSDEGRVLEVSITYADGVVKKLFTYGVEAQESLVVMKNSFQSYVTALITARSRVNIDTFVNSTEERQKAALKEAYHRITNLSLIYSVVDADGVVTDTGIVSTSAWPYINADAFMTGFPSHFRKALQIAQVIEADELLQGSVAARKHAQGIASETIGESSVTFKSGFSGVSDGGVSAAAMSVLSGYLYRVVKTGRA